MTRIKLTGRTEENTIPYSPEAARAAGCAPGDANVVAPGATEEVNYFCLASWKGALKLESKGLKSSGGAIRPRIAARLGLKPRQSYDVFIAKIQQLMDQIIAERQASRAGDQ
jgi:hypothetical protein